MKTAQTLTRIGPLSLFLAIGAAGCGDAATADDVGVEESAIIGGQVLADAARAPFAVYLTMSKGFAGEGKCSGVVIGPQHVLTAAHCLRGDIERIVVERRQSGDPPNAPSLGFAIATGWRMHPRYLSDNDQSGTSPLFDVAVVKTTVPTVPWTAARLAPDAPTVGDKLVEYGYGDTALGAQNLGTLKRRNISVTEAGTRAFSAGRASCFGDSGGPAIYKKGGKVFVAGILNITNCASFSQFSSVAGYEPFIRDAMTSL